MLAAMARQIVKCDAGARERHDWLATVALPIISEINNRPMSTTPDAREQY